MTRDQKLIRAKVGLLELDRQPGNVIQACEAMGYSRDSFYRFKDLYDMRPSRLRDCARRARRLTIAETDRMRRRAPP